MDTQYTEATITKADDGSFIAIASTNSVDRHGEVVDNNGWDLKAFNKNPVLLWRIREPLPSRRELFWRRREPLPSRREP